MRCWLATLTAAAEGTTRAAGGRGGAVGWPHLTAGAEGHMGLLEEEECTTRGCLRMLRERMSCWLATHALADEGHTGAPGLGKRMCCLATLTGAAEDTTMGAAGGGLGGEEELLADPTETHVQYDGGGGKGWGGEVLLACQIGSCW